LQRLLILGLGVLSVWLIVDVFEFVDRRLPWILAIALTYGFAAYVILPRAVRMGLKIQQRKRVPSFTTTGDGLPGDPVNLALIGTLPQLRAAFATVGWAEADQLGLASSWRMVRAFVLKSPYPTAPFSTLYLFARGQDIGFQKAIDNSPRKRHHVRFWTSRRLTSACSGSAPAPRIPASPSPSLRSRSPTPPITTPTPSATTSSVSWPKAGSSRTRRPTIPDSRSSASTATSPMVR
jgi:hypothetical protein